jgi:hypothetical protein
LLHCSMTDARLRRFLLLVLAMPALAMLTPLASAQSDAPSTPVVANPADSKKCQSATRKVEKEQSALTLAVDLLAKDTKGREACTSPSMCARYDAAISSTDKRKTRHEARLARFKEDADAACKETEHGSGAPDLSK